MEKGANINIQIWMEETPLHIACKEDHLKIAQLLLEKGADIEAKNNEGETPLDIAKKHSNKKLIELFGSFRKKDK